MAKAAATSGELALTSSQRVFNFSTSSSVLHKKIFCGRASAIIRTFLMQPQTKALAAKAAAAEKDVEKEDKDAGCTDGETPEHKAGDQVVTDEPVADNDEEGKAKQQRLRHLAWHQRELEEEEEAEARRCCICLCLTALVCLCWAA